MCIYYVKKNITTGQQVKFLMTKKMFQIKMKYND